MSRQIAVLKTLFYCCFAFFALLSGCGSLQVEVQVIDPRIPTVTATSRAVVELPTDAPTLIAVSTPSPSPTPRCPIPFFFGNLADACPDDAAETLDAAFQVFNGGYMLWEASTSSVYVLYDDGSGVRFPADVVSEWAEMPITEVPPRDHFRPIRGFNRVWTHEAAIRERLGWATGIEQAYTTQFQNIGDFTSDDSRIFMGLPNGQVIEFTALNEWRVIR